MLFAVAMPKLETTIKTIDYLPLLSPEASRTIPIILLLDRLLLPKLSVSIFTDTIIGLYALLFRFTDLKKLKPVGIGDLTA